MGFDSDTPSIFQKQIDFIQKSGIVTAMVGLLQAPSGTELYRRLKKEDRLREEISGDNVDGSTNIIPRMDLQVLKDGYSQMMMKIYSPNLFYERIRNFLREYNPGGAPPILSGQNWRPFSNRSIYWGSGARNGSITGD